MILVYALLRCPDSPFWTKRVDTGYVSDPPEKISTLQFPAPGASSEAFNS